ncbi:hypothetical protein QFZ75_002015 [Streptomyces sp. V3I8]|uniref:hypothetical protein n=1 Tax=Streptomyces sp. V3I8 TaxID=3042279 RepID=UPI0027889C67|nr:hypothetical protein [Streptomyces sp. V3I8]MDQ1035599.1 hypothetical protein [Streptomyces sp. V3I8]
MSLSLGGSAPGTSGTFGFTLRPGGPGEDGVRVADTPGTARRDAEPADDTAPVTFLP